MRTLRNLHVLSCVVCMFLFANKSLAQLSEGIRVPFPADDTMFALVFHPQNMIESAKSVGNDGDRFLDLMNEEFSVDFNSVEQVHVQYFATLDNRNFFSLSAIFEGSAPRKDLEEGLFKDFEFETATHEGQDYRHPGTDFGPCMYFPDKQILLLTTEERMKQAIETIDDAEHPDALTELTPDCDVCGYFDFAKDEDVVEEMLTEIFEGAPFYDSDFRDALSKVKRGYYRFDLTSDEGFYGVMETSSEANAKLVAEEFNRAAESFAEFCESRVDEADEDDHAYEKFQNELFEGMLILLENAEAQPNGPDVEVTIKVNGGIADSLNHFVRGWNVMISDK